MDVNMIVYLFVCLFICLLMCLFVYLFTDIDECLSDTDGCEHDCVNDIGTYRCTCQSGYTLTSGGKNCICKYFYYHYQCRDPQNWGSNHEKNAAIRRSHGPLHESICKKCCKRKSTKRTDIRGHKHLHDKLVLLSTSKRVNLQNSKSIYFSI